MSHSRLAALFLTAALPIAWVANGTRAEDFQGSTHKVEFDIEPINYTDSEPSDPIAKLQKQLAAGEAKLDWDDKFGYLPSLLDLLEIPRSSQMLVFSKTSLQRRHITPTNPRAIYFNDDVYVGYIPGSEVMEISSVDPKLGGIFYRLDNEKVRRPRFMRDAQCLQCHAGPKTMGVPGHMVRSIAADETGEIDNQNEIPDITHCAPIEDRWGGWYVTGNLGTQSHRGNLIGSAAFAKAAKEPNPAGNCDNLDKYFDTTKYLKPRSDVVALMVLEHQTHMHNYITRLNFDSQIMTAMYGHTRYLKNQVEAFLRYLLFVEEAPIKERIAGDADFIGDFMRPAKRDSKGRSLRDLDLEKRMFKHPCSFLIYSEAFDSMHEPIREHILQRLYDILTGKELAAPFDQLSADDRTAILEILRETKPNLPEYWREG